MGKSKVETVAEIIKAQGNKAVTVTFIKRTTGEKRVMNCRLGVKKHLKGGELKYDPKDYQLLTIYDLQKHDYRCISLDSVEKVVASGITYQF